MPNLYIIAGCNGAGKTTASFNLLLDILDCKNLFFADKDGKIYFVKASDLKV
jgi:predicted ABC-type ATPase